jgi:hypothetical protein
MTPAVFKIAGAILLAVLLAQFLAVLLRAIRRQFAERARRQEELAGFQQRLALARLQSKKAEKHVSSWNGSRKFRIERKVRECDNVVSFYLRPQDERALPSYRAGQYLTFELEIPGQAKRIIRCYSLSDRPRQDYYRVTIKQIGPRPECPATPPGIASTFFHSVLKEGDFLNVKAPSGNFFLESTGDEPVVLIAGGIGLTPLLSMLNEMTETGSGREIWLFYGLRRRGDHLMKEHLENLSRKFANVHLHISYSHPNEQDRAGADYHHTGHITVELIKQLLPSSHCQFYLCGPPPMLSALTAGLLEWAVPVERIHLEAFGSASVKSVGTSERQSAHAPGPGGLLPATLPPASLTVQFARSGKALPWSGKEESLLEFAETAGVAIDCGCRAGNCGTCKTMIKSGQVSYWKEPGCGVEPGSCLVCICAPKSDLVLEA